MQKALGDKAQQVRVSRRLTDSPACLVSDHGMNRNLERMLKEAGQPVPPNRPVMEINPDHPIVERLKEETDDQTVLQLDPDSVRPGAAGRRQPARRPRQALSNV